MQVVLGLANNDKAESEAVYDAVENVAAGTSHIAKSETTISRFLPAVSARNKRERYNNIFNLFSISSQRECLDAFCHSRLWHHRAQLIKPHQVITIGTCADHPELSGYYRQQQKPLQVIDDNVATLHRVYPIRGEKHVLQTERYFSQLISPCPKLLAEPLDHSCIEFAAIIHWQHGETNAFSAIQNIFMMQTDHGVLQELFSAEPMSDLLMLQLGLIVEAVIMTFALYNCRFTLFFERYADQLWFSHIDINNNLITLVIDSVSDDFASLSKASLNLAAKFNYQASVITTHHRDQLINTANKQLLLRHIVLNNQQKQLDCPFGVTIAFSDDVRAALRLCIRVENVLKGRLAHF